MSFEVFLVRGIDAEVGIAVGIGSFIDSLEASVCHSDIHTCFDLISVLVKIVHWFTSFLTIGIGLQSPRLYEVLP